MKVRDLIKELLDYDMDAQVYDINGSPIYSVAYNKDNPEPIKLESWNDVDIQDEICAMVEESYYLTDSNESSTAAWIYGALRNKGVLITKSLAYVIISHAYYYEADKDNLIHDTVWEQPCADFNDPDAFKRLIDLVENKIFLRTSPV